MELEVFINEQAYPWGIKIVSAILVFVIGRMVVKAIVGLIGKLLSKSKTIDEMLVHFVLSLLNGILILFVIIAALSQLGVDTSSLVALIAAAGLAIGLALQDSLQNFAAGAMLLVFKPFTKGDFIEAAEVSGVVEKIEIFSTTLRTGDNKEVIVPNGAIYKDPIINYSARATRRIDMVFTIDYNDDLRVAKAILEKLLTEDERILAEPKPVVALSELADNGVNFIVRPWAATADYWKVYWDMNERVKLAFDEAGITVPYRQMGMLAHKKEEKLDDETD